MIAANRLADLGALEELPAPIQVTDERQPVAVGGRHSADEALALAIASGVTVAEAAHLAGIGERTAYRRRAEPAFRKRVLELRSGMLDRALGRMADGMVEAADKLRSLLNAGSEAVQLQAAARLLELGWKARERVDLEAEIAELESQLAGPSDPLPEE